MKMGSLADEASLGETLCLNKFFKRRS
jgi:hypothetical protein